MKVAKEDKELFRALRGSLGSYIRKSVKYKLGVQEILDRFFCKTRNKHFFVLLEKYPIEMVQFSRVRLLQLTK